jgi:hypothetical protein
MKEEKLPKPEVWSYHGFHVGFTPMADKKGGMLRAWPAGDPLQSPPHVQPPATTKYIDRERRKKRPASRKYS